MNQDDDGRLIRSPPPLGNLMLEDTIERYYLDLEWADEALGIFLVRGENVVLIGDIVLEHHPPIFIDADRTDV